MVVESLVLLSCFLAALAAVMGFLAMRSAARAATPSGEVIERLALVHQAAQEHPRMLRDETARLGETQARESAALRDEVLRAVQGFQSALGDRFDRVHEAQERAAATLRKELTESQGAASQAVKASTEQLGEYQRDRLLDMARRQQEALDKVAAELAAVKSAAAEDSEKQRARLSEEMATLRRENDAKLEQMRATVDEKLQGTLEQRLGESFKLVSDRLETVHRGLGEMQSLATGVGDLKRIMANVKTRGIFGEVQLGGLLEDVLTRDQYETQARVHPQRGEIADFIVRLPEAVLPIDCKFPQDDYERLLAAQDAGDAALVDAAGKALERAVRIQAKSISEKYIHPPYSTPFAVMYLPTEGLFAEVVRRPGLAADLQQTCRVIVAGPTTLSAMLNSFRMGFQTLAIQKRSNEVWQVLGAAKAEFEKYGTVWDKLARQLETATKTVDEARSKTKTITSKLKSVQSADIPALTPPPLFALEFTEEVEAGLDEAA